MKRLVILSLVAVLAACDEAPTDLPHGPDVDPSLSVVGASPLVGAIVLNRGQASAPFTGSCQLAGRFTTDVQLVRTPTGGGLLTCRWTPWPTTTVFERAFRASGFNCFLNFFGFTTTNDSQFVIARNGEVATLVCRFQEVGQPGQGV